MPSGRDMIDSSGISISPSRVVQHFMLTGFPLFPTPTIPCSFGGIGIIFLVVPKFRQQLRALWAGFGGHFVLATDQLVNFLAVDADVSGGLHPDANLISPDFNDFQCDRIANPYAFPGLPCQY